MDAQDAITVEDAGVDAYTDGGPDAEIGVDADVGAGETVAIQGEQSPPDDTKGTGSIVPAIGVVLVACLLVALIINVTTE